MREVLQNTRRFIYDNEEEMFFHIEEMESNGYCLQHKTHGLVFIDGNFKNKWNAEFIKI